MTQRKGRVRSGMRCAGWFAATIVVTTALAVLHARVRIAPVIIADNAYVFLAADRLYAGLGLTAPPPRVPAQAWDWRGDWTFVSQWPMGYPLILCAVRGVLGVETARAAVALSVLSCGVALMAWFALIHRCLPKRWPAALIALLAAAGTFSLSNLVNPASDTLLLALTPLVLLLAWPALGWTRQAPDDEPEVRGQYASESAAPACGVRRLALLGLFGFLAGVLVWIRYAAIFVPLGIGVFLTIEWLWGRRVRLVQVVVYGLTAAAPILALAAVNRVLNADLPFQQQYPLGDRLSADLPVGTLVTAWDQFTAQTFYAHRPESKWFFALAVPLGGLFLPFAFADSRRLMRRFLASPAVRLCAVTTATCLIMLIGLSVAFKERFDYAALDRYYMPIRPFYFLFFVGGILAFKPRVVRILACVPLLMACSWTFNQDWARACQRVASRQHDVTPYGRRAMYFMPHSSALYGWLGTQRSDDLLVLSNFPDDIALETWIPACPTPRDPAEMEAWIARVKQARGVPEVRVLFVLDPSNHSRHYFLPPPADLVADFDLIQVADVPRRIAPYVYAPRVVRSARAGPEAPDD